MFHECTDLYSIPLFDMSKGTDFYYTFGGCSCLLEIPQLDLSNGTYFYGTFIDCPSLTTIPKLDTSKGSNFTGMFSNCESLRSVKLTSIRGSTNNMFYNCSSLISLEVSGTIDISSNYFNLSYSPELSVQSLLNVLEALSDNTKQTKYTVTFGETNLSKLTDEQKQIAKDKNYLLT